MHSPFRPLPCSCTNCFFSGHESVGDTMQQKHSNAQGVAANGQLTGSDTAIDTTTTMTAAVDLNPAGPTPVDDVTGGVQPVADFLPKDATNLSHPTPPPDEPLTSGAADVDVEMGNAENEVLPSMIPLPQAHPGLRSTQLEQSLVRPREDDGDDERAAKRSRVDDEIVPAVDMPASAEATVLAEPVAAPSIVAPSEAEAVAEATLEPLVEASRMDIAVESTQPEAQSAEAPVPSVESNRPAAAGEETQVEGVAATVETTAEDEPRSQAATDSAANSRYSTKPMTLAQKNFLAEKVKNLKKTKHSSAFLRPVDTSLYPNYLDVVGGQPMDLSTMDSKLKEGRYHSVQDFANDFDLIISNVRKFNGDTHAVTQAGFAMEAYFNKVMESVPSSDVVAPVKSEKKRSPSINREKPTKRESRAAAVPPPTPAAAPAPAAPAQTYALQADGTPQIRRQSSNLVGRPARAIKPPQAREIPYAKPKRKEHQLELKFCERTLEDIRSPKFGAVNSVFQMPVDPVALNIPHYRQVIKNPMDLGTMAIKLKQGEYGTAVEFKKDFDLIIKNCLAFNPAGNPVRDMGIGLAREFEQLWANKDKWERKNKPASTRASSASADDDSAADDEDEDDDNPDDDKTATIRALQKQLADMQNALSGMAGDKSAKAKKAKSSKASTKKLGGGLSSAPAKSKAPARATTKTKKPKQVTYDEKQEISDAVGRMDEKQVGVLTEIITKNCAKYRDMEEMELEIDDLPNDVQAMLLDYVRGIFGNPSKKKGRDTSPEDAAALDDDDYMGPDKGARGGKRKKHRPMGKKEQQDTIEGIQKQLAQFSQNPTSGSESPGNSSFAAANAQAETSPDEESEESEEE